VENKVILMEAAIKKTLFLFLFVKRSMQQEKTATVIGAGLVGSLWAVYLSKAGYKVTLYERRPDIRQAEITAGKSINLALSVRGWTALDTVGVGDEIRKIAIPMYGRCMTLKAI
jgi:kynurenine 3-monooxygenase